MQHRFHFYGIWLGLAIYVTVMSLMIPAVRAQATIPDLLTYEGWLREARVAASRGDRLGLEQVAANLTQTTQVRVADDIVVPVNNDWLAAALDKPDPDLPFIDARLGALLDALVQPDPVVPTDARQRLDTILNHPPFAEVEQPRLTLIGRLLDWVLRLLARVFRQAEVDSVTGQAMTLMIAGIGMLLLLGMLIYLLRGLRGSWVRESQMNDTDDPEAYLTANTALHQATMLARGGDYRTAVRYLYLSSLLWLDERGMLRYDRALTNREYLERLNDNPELRLRLVPIVDTFDRVWYGHMALDAESFAAYQQQVDGLRKLRL